MSEQLTPRIATADDEPLIKQIYKQNSDELGGFNLFYSWDDFLAKKSPYKFYVIENKAFMRFGYSKQKKCWVIKEIGVLEEHKGQGLAAIFFQGLPAPLYLTCNEDNDSGNRFYKKLGMRKMGQVWTKNKKRKMNVWVL